MGDRESAEYVIPLRWSTDTGLAEMTSYLRELTTWIDVTVMDGSDETQFRAHADAWLGIVRHLPVDCPGAGNGKVYGVLAGVAAARHEHIILADDDVRYDRSAATAVICALRDADLVTPQNYFSPAPWHARWDTGRSLLNRALGADYPGTYGLRRSTFIDMGGYDPDVLFENLELERTVRTNGGRIAHRPDIYVARRPPSARHFRSQRVRQAYDSWAQPARLLAEAAILPLVLWSLRKRMRGIALFGTILVIAERGRRRSNGHTVFPRSAPWWAPLWVLERGVTIWVALVLRLRGGVRYGDSRLKRAAHSEAQLRSAIRRGVRPQFAASAHLSRR